MIDQLPENLFVEILSCLPVKSLLQCKRVSKSWYKIIRSPYFISMQLKHNYGRPTNCLIAQYNLDPKFGYGILPADELQPYMVRIGDADEGNIIHNDRTFKRDPPYNYDICGPCYGIYYLWCPWCDKHVSWNDRRFLWNPALKEIKKLPPIMKHEIFGFDADEGNIIHRKELEEVCGFGFDPVTVDYKVVALKEYGTIRIDEENGWRPLFRYPLSILIYSLRKDSWKYSGDLSTPYYVTRENSCHAFVNRRFYWLGSFKDRAIINDVIIAIDLATEECQEIGLPYMRVTRVKGKIADATYSECLMVYNGSIALVVHYKKVSNFDIWTLKGTTWSKELTVKLDCLVRRAIGHFSVDNNLLVFDSPNCLILCDPDTEKTSKLNVPVLKNARCEIVAAYMESLVPLNDRDFWERKDEDRENRNSGLILV